jgi:L-glyceraldehyde 3-phosphate reductase
MTYVPVDDRYEHMRYRRSGRSGLQLPAVSLGLWQNFGYDRPLDTSRAIVRRAFPPLAPKDGPIEALEFGFTSTP